MGITEIIDSPAWEAKNPAVGNTASVGIGGTIVSSSAAKKTPSYRWPARKSPIHTRNESKGSNRISKETLPKLLYNIKILITSVEIFLDNQKTTLLQIPHNLQWD